MNPRVFDPNRHSAAATMNEQYGIDADSKKRAHFTFGAGRRVCPGFHVAERGLFIAISRLLWAFRFERSRDETGQIVPIDHDAVTDGLIVRPIPYKYDLACSTRLVVWLKVLDAKSYQEMETELH